jgi:hypothetical protein
MIASGCLVIAFIQEFFANLPNPAARVGVERQTGERAKPLLRRKVFFFSLASWAGL